jgi:hypothetical protein
MAEQPEALHSGVVFPRFGGVVLLDSVLPN